MNYAKLINGAIQFAPNHIILDDRQLGRFPA